MIVKTIKTYWKDNEFKQNTYIVEGKAGAIIFDAGASVNELINNLQTHKVLAIFITHCHFDHILYIEEYQKMFNCPIYISRHGIDFLNDSTLNASSLLGDPTIYSIHNILFCENGTRLKYGFLLFLRYIHQDIQLIVFVMSLIIAMKVKSLLCFQVTLFLQRHWAEQICPRATILNL